MPKVTDVTRQRESLLILMDNYKTMTKLQDTMAQSTGSAEQKFEEAYGKSTEAKINDLKNAMERLWLSIFNSNTINKVVSGVEKFVEVLTQLTSVAKVSGISILVLGSSLLLLMINAKNSITVIGGLIKLMMGQTTLLTMLRMNFAGLIGVFANIKKAFALLLTPQGLIFTAIAVSLGLATTAIIKHTNHMNDLKQKTDELTTSYKDLKQAISDMDIEQQKSSAKPLQQRQSELQLLMQKRQEIQNKIDDLAKSGGLFKDSSSNNIKYHKELIEINNQINDVTKTIKDAGLTVDETTGKIKELDAVQVNANMQETADNIRKESEENVKKRNSIIDLITEYNNLSGVENKSQIQTERMSQITSILQNSIQGLIIAKDKEGNLTIQNINLLDEQVKKLKAENNEEETATKVILENAKKKASIQIGMTTITYEEISKRIALYQEEAKAMDVILAQQNDINGTVVMNTGMSNRMKKLYEELPELQRIKDKIDVIYSPNDNGNNGNNGIEPPSNSGTTNTVEANPKNSPYLNLFETINNTVLDLDKNIDKVKANMEQLNKSDILKDKIELLKEQNNLYDLQSQKLNNLQYNNSMQEGSMRSLLGTMENEFRNSYRGNAYGLGEKSEAWFKDLESEIFPTRTFNNSDESKAYEEKKKAYENFIQDYFKVRDAVHGIDKEIVSINSDMIETLKTIAQLDIDTVVSGIKEKVNKNKVRLDNLGNVDTDNERLAELTIYSENLDYYNDMYEKSVKIISDNRVKYDNAKLKDIKDLTMEDIYVISKYEDAVKERDEASVNLVNTMDKTAQLYGEFITHSFEENIKNLNDSISLMGNIDTTEERNKVIGYYKQIETELKNELKNIQDELNNNKLILIDPKATQVQKDVAQRIIDSIKDKNVKVQLDIQANEENYISVVKDILNKAGDEAKNKLEENFKLYERSINDKISQLDKQYETEDYNNDMKAQQDKVTELQKRINELSLNDDVESKNKRKDLEQDLADAKNKITDMQLKRNRDLQKQSLQDQLEVERRNNEDRKQAIDDFFASIENNFNNLNIASDTFQTKFSTGINEVAKTVRSTFITAINDAIVAVNKLNELKLSIPSTTGTNDSISSTTTTSTQTNSSTNPLGNGTDDVSFPRGYTMISGKVYSPDYIASHFMEINNLLQTAKNIYIKDLQGIIHDLFTNKVVDPKDIKKFKSGGYTGNGEGLAWLDEKELILDKFDTSNILKVIDITKQLLSRFNITRTPSLTGIGGNTTIQVDNLINVEGNLDKDILPDVERIANNLINNKFVNIQRILKSNGISIRV
jgi:hypothetical protein